MAKVFISPSRYVQGAGELRHLGSYAEKIREKGYAAGEPGRKEPVGDLLEESFRKSDCGYVFEVFQGECCKKEIRRLQERMETEGCDLIIGIGGGKIFDTAKAAAYYQRTPVLICPTIASTDAPCSALS